MKENKQEISKALTLSKAKLGISSQIRDEYLTAIIDGVVQELTEINGILIDLEDNLHLMYVVDLSVHRYENSEDAGLPRNLQLRLHNLIFQQGDINVE